MDNLQAMVLKAVKQLEETDLEAISDNTGIPPSIVKGVCNYLTRYGYLTQSQGGYRVTPKATRALYEKEQEIEIK